MKNAWKKEKRLGQTNYVRGPFRIEPRWRFNYLGGGRQSSVRVWYLLRDGELVATSENLRGVKAAATANEEAISYRIPTVVEGRHEAI